MNKNYIVFLLLVLFLFILPAFAYDVSSQQYTEIIKNLTPAQQQAVVEEVLKKYTPEQINQLLQEHKEINISDEIETSDSKDEEAQQSSDKEKEQSNDGEKGKSSGKEQNQSDDAKKGKSSDKEKEQSKKQSDDKDNEDLLPFEEDDQTKKMDSSLFQRYIDTEDIDKLDFSGKDLKPYGYNFFSQSFSESTTINIPVPDDYIVGPGDRIILFLWGRLSGKYELTIDREGVIEFPEIGPIPVAGMTLNDMKSLLKKQAKQIVGTNISISMGRLKTIQVYVTGEVKIPGSYLISSLSSVTDALIKANGPSNIGSFRNIHLIRGEKIVNKFDFYQLLQTGNISGDIRLRNGDVIFIPPVGDLVGIIGNVKRPAIYELKDKKDLHTILELSGGIIPSAYKQQVQIERFKNYQSKIILDINLNQVDGYTTLLKDGDLVKIFPVTSETKNIVKLSGNVLRPGQYQWTNGLKISDLIVSQDNLLHDTYMDYSLIKRVNPTTLTSSVLSFNLGKALKKDKINDIILRPEDEIVVFSRWSFMPKSQIEISGEIRDPGIYEITENSKIKDIILIAQGLTRDAAFHTAELVRKTSDKQYKLIKFSPTLVMKDDEKNNIKVQDGDQIIIHSISEEKPFYEVKISGDVHNPGKYILTKGETVADLIFRAGGLNESAYIEKAEITRSDIIKGKNFQIVRKTISLSKALKGDKKHNIELKPYDDLIIKKIPKWQDVGTVKIEGAVVFPNEYTIKNGEKLSSLLRRAGGYSDKAFLKGAFLSRQDIRIAQESHINKIFKTLEADIQKDAASMRVSSFSSEDAASINQSIEYRQKILEKLKKIEVPGRLNIKFQPIDDMENTPDDVVLKDQDIITIPQRPGTVQVLGMVYNASAFVYRPNLRIEDYLSMAGGPTEHGDQKKIYLAKADGTTIALTRNKFLLVTSNRYLSDIEEIKIEEGDVIIVPETTYIPGQGWKKVRELVQFVYNTAASMASLKYILD